MKILKAAFLAPLPGVALAAPAAPPDFSIILDQVVSVALPWALWSAWMSVSLALLAYYGVGIIWYLLRGRRLGAAGDPFRSKGSLLLKKEIFPQGSRGNSRRYRGRRR